MKLVFVSDTHGMHRNMKFQVPGGDVLVHCGDMTGHGRMEEVVRVADWLAEYPHTHKLIVAGNHDGACEYDEEAAREVFRERGLLYLCNNGVTLDGIKFWGAPWTPNFCNWHFMPPRDGSQLQAHWDLIPDDTEVLITHGPPSGILDAYKEQRYIEKAGMEHVGCMLLRARIEHLPALRLHAFGHIHEGYGQRNIVLDNMQLVKFVNAAICTREYKPTNAPIEVEL